MQCHLNINKSGGGGGNSGCMQCDQVC